MTNKLIFRQGDVLITQVDDLPENLKPTSRVMAGKNLVTLAFGEVTGHHHSLKQDGSVALVETDIEEGKAQEIFLKIMGDSATLTHQEHAPIAIPKGNYRISIQKEYTPEAIQNVLD